MAIVLAILGAIPAIYGIMKFFQSSPQQKQAKYYDDLGNAMKKATDEKDPSSLSDFINKH